MTNFFAYRDQNIKKVEHLMARELARAQFVIAYIANHPEQAHGLETAKGDLMEMIKKIKEIKLKNPRINMVFSAASLGLGASGGLVSFCKSLVDELIGLQISVNPSDPLSVIGFYHTQIVIPLLGAAMLGVHLGPLIAAVNALMGKLGITNAQLDVFAHRAKPAGG